MKLDVKQGLTPISHLVTQSTTAGQLARGLEAFERQFEQSW